MGVSIKAKDVDAESYAVEYSAPVRRGLQGIHFLNQSVEKAAHNYAPGKTSGTVAGAPVPSAGYLTCTNMANYIQTDVVESDLMTIFVAARAATDGTDSATRAMFTSTFRGVAADGGVAQGVGVYVSAANSINGFAGFGADAAGDTRESAVITDTPTAWGLYMVQVSAGAVSVRDFTRNLTATENSAAGRRKTTSKLRIGSGYTYAGSGQCNVGVWQAHDVVLTESEIQTTVADLRAYMLRKGVTV